jgi:hydrogenase maturation protease
VHETAPTPVLVVGFGSTIRRDDAVGQRAAEQIEGWGYPGVRALVRTQLTPDLAAELASADVAYFIDAVLAPVPRGVQVERLSPSAGQPTSLIHAASPGLLLNLCEALYGRTPEAYVVSIPIEDFDFGEGLSALAEQGLRDALAILHDILNAPITREPGPDAACPSSGRDSEPPRFTRPGTCS